jgi:hypothetical protein
MGRICMASLSNDNTGTNITTTGYLELSAALPEDTNSFDCFDSSGQMLSLAIGPSGGEVEVIKIPPGGQAGVQQLFNKGQRLSVKALTADATFGTFMINMYR